jgi:hypothetical protein
MIAILLILLITLAAAAVLVLRYALTDKGQQKDLQPPNARGLFSDPAPQDDAPQDDAARGNDEKSAAASNRRKELIARARAGDAGALANAHRTGDHDLYKEALDGLIEQASGRHEAFGALVNHIAKSDELRASIKLAEMVISRWKAAPDRHATIEMLHIAALSDDAATYQKAVEEVLRFRNTGKLASFDASELVALVESEYWVLASEARMGGAGFRLKRMLADARRELATATPAR